MNRNRREIFNEERETNKILIISFSVLLIAILAFTITFVVYRNYLNKQIEISEVKTTKIGKTEQNNQEETSQVSLGIGKTVNEMQESTNEIENTTNTEKIAINVSNMQVESENEETEKKSNIEKNIDSNSKNTTKTTNATETKKEEKPVEPSFKKPVEGEITNAFAKDTLIYSNTLQEWVTHNGIDIKADKTSIVKASEAGTVKSIKNDPRYGITVVIEHSSGFASVYANLLTAEFIKEGEKVEQNQTIGTVGNTATFEIADAPHLHFEILKDNEYVDPLQYIK